jgi:hypothetical protein
MPVSQIEHDTQLRRVLFELLSQTTIHQQEFFERLYPMGINQIPYEKLNWAIQLCQRAIQKNKLNAGLEQPTMDALMNQAVARVEERKRKEERNQYLSEMIESLKKAKEADIAISITREEKVSDEEIKLPIIKLKQEFKCIECGETNPDLQFMQTEYCHICINK